MHPSLATSAPNWRDTAKDNFEKSAPSSSRLSQTEVQEEPPCSLHTHRQKLGFLVAAEAAKVQETWEAPEPHHGQQEQKTGESHFWTPKNELRLDSHRKQHPGSRLSQRTRLSLKAWTLLRNLKEGEQWHARWVAALPMLWGRCSNGQLSTQLSGLSTGQKQMSSEELQPEQCTGAHNRLAVTHLSCKALTCLHSPWRAWYCCRYHPEVRSLARKPKLQFCLLPTEKLR